MRTAAVVLNYGDPSDTLECVESLELSDDLDIDLYVVDNGPADARHEALRAMFGHYLDHSEENIPVHTWDVPTVEARTGQPPVGEERSA